MQPAKIAERGAGRSHILNLQRLLLAPCPKLPSSPEEFDPTGGEARPFFHPSLSPALFRRPKMTERKTNLPPSSASLPARPTSADPPCPHADDAIFRTLVKLVFKLDGCRVRACHRRHRCTASSGHPAWPRCLAVLSEADRATTRREFHRLAAGARDKLGRDPDPWPLEQGPLEQDPAVQKPAGQHPTGADEDAIGRRRLDVILLNLAFGFRHPVHGARVRAWVRSDPDWPSDRAAMQKPSRQKRPATPT
jgi:hypothetical protein